MRTRSLRRASGRRAVQRGAGPDGGRHLRVAALPSRRSSASIPIRNGRRARRSWRPTPTTRPTSTTKRSQRPERFIELHPGHEDVPYAYYLVGMCYYEQISDIGRDQEMTRVALELAGRAGAPLPAERLCARCRAQDRPGPRSSRRQGDGDRPLLPGASKYVAAINRFRNVVEQVPDHDPCAGGAASADREPIWRWACATRRRTSAAVLGYNFPGNDWYERLLCAAGGAEPRADAERGLLAAAGCSEPARRAGRC